MQHGDTSAHTEAGVHHVQRCHGTQGVASDITGSMQSQLLQYGVGTAVRAARTQDGRTVRNLRCRLNLHRLSQELLTEHICAVLALSGEELLAFTLDTPGANLLFDHRLQFLHDDQALHL